MLAELRLRIRLGMGTTFPVVHTSMPSLSRSRHLAFQPSAEAFPLFPSYEMTTDLETPQKVLGSHEKHHKRSWKVLENTTSGPVMSWKLHKRSWKSWKTTRHVLYEPSYSVLSLQPEMPKERDYVACILSRHSPCQPPRKMVQAAEAAEYRNSGCQVATRCLWCDS